MIAVLKGLPPLIALDEHHWFDRPDTIVHGNLKAKVEIMKLLQCAVCKTNLFDIINYNGHSAYL